MFLWKSNICDFSELLGKTLTQIVIPHNTTYPREIVYFYCSDGSKYSMYHEQDCCEHVYLEEIVGDLDSLLNSPILLAEDVYNKDDCDDESCTWTFYKLSTINGSVTFRWYGSSNGYYSEDVGFYKEPENES